MTNEQSIVKVDRLTKRIGSKTLVQNISFEVKKARLSVYSDQTVLENDFNENDGWYDPYDRR